MLEKIAFQIVEKQDAQSQEEIVIDNKNLSKYIGHPKFPAGRFYEETPAVSDSSSQFSFMTFYIVGCCCWFSIYRIWWFFNLPRSNSELFCSCS